MQQETVITKVVIHVAAICMHASTAIDKAPPTNDTNAYTVVAVHHQRSGLIIDVEKSWNSLSCFGKVSILSNCARQNARLVTSSTQRKSFSPCETLLRNTMLIANCFHSMCDRLKTTTGL
jgi:hypothetical protein